MRMIAIGAAALALAGCATSPGMQRARLSVTLTGLQAVPGPGDPDGSGTAEIRTDPQNGRVCWDLYVRGIDPPTAAHIHRGPEGTAGPPVVTLTTPDSAGRSRGCAEAPAETVSEIGLRPYDYYVNVHTEAAPAGAIRGQLRGELRRIRQPDR